MPYKTICHCSQSKDRWCFWSTMFLILIICSFPSLPGHTMKLENCIFLKEKRKKKGKGLNNSMCWYYVVISTNIFIYLKRRWGTPWICQKISIVYLLLILYNCVRQHVYRLMTLGIFK